ncbi:MAG: 50S ribosomal protein L21 [Micavibrio sp.]
MFAVIRTGGKQYRVTKGDQIKVEKLDIKEGGSVDVELLGSFDGKALSMAKNGAKLAAKVVSHGRNDKIVVFKKKRRQNYRRTAGHRQHYTVLEFADVAA